MTAGKPIFPALLVGIMAGAIAGCASAPAEPDPAANAETGTSVAADAVQVDPPAGTPDARDADGEPAAAGEPVEELPLLDRAQRAVFNVVNTTSQRFDSFFGSTELAEGENVSRGRLSVGGQWDQRDGFKERLRMKARIPLPALRNRTSLVFGRGDADDFVDGSSSENIDNLPDRFNAFEEDDWLLGLGYARHHGIARGWDVSIGMKLGSPVEPYVQTTYRWNRHLGEAWLWRVRPRLFVQNERGAGASLTNILDYAVSTTWMLRSWTILKTEDEVEGMGWTTKLASYHALRGKDAISYSVFGTGETLNDVALQDYGVEVLYRKRIARDWFFVDVWTRLSWPREFLEEAREANWGVGLEFEMQFGDWPGRPQER
ncbi:MAG: hypothetical protein OEX13_14520 [Gammaproteobacteria bacterium]|nr:hypothetical protein [Gammaproteobacteria bacterium]